MQILDARRQLHRFVARWRLRWGLCPRCNSDAPAIDDCHVCQCGMLGGDRDKGILDSRWFDEIQKAATGDETEKCPSCDVRTVPLRDGTMLQCRACDYSWEQI